MREDMSGCMRRCAERVTCFTPSSTRRSNNQPVERGDVVLCDLRTQLEVVADKNEVLGALGETRDDTRFGHLGSLLDDDNLWTQSPHHLAVLGCTVRSHSNHSRTT